MIRKLTIAIDGPSGAGKSTVARRVASVLGYTYIDTGAMYRAVALRGLQQNVPVDDEAETVRIAEAMRVAFRPGDGDDQRVLLDGDDVTDAVRTPEVTRLSSPVSAISGVRRVLVARQRAMGKDGGVVMEGRDIGTIVFPNADLKVFLTASEEERARRRWLERRSRGDPASLQAILHQQRERDARDSSRADSPLCAAPDAIAIDSDGIPFEAVVQRILDLVRTHGADAT